MRSRRRWRWAIAGTAMVGAAYPALVAPRLAEGGLGAAIPGAVLVLWPAELPACLTPYLDPSSGDEGLIQEELARRAGSHRLPDWQFAILHRRIAAAHPRRGVSVGERRALELLESIPLRRRPDGAWDADLPAQVRAAGLEVRWDGSPVRLMPLALDGSDLGPSPSLLDGLLRAFAWPRSHGWAPEAGGIRLVPGFDFERQMTCVVYDTGDVAPVRVVFEPLWYCEGGPVGRPVRQVNDDDQRRLVDAMTSVVRPRFWADAGGDLGRVTAVGQSLVVFAAPAMHVGIERFVGGLRTSLGRGPGSATRIPGTGNERRASVWAYHLGEIAKPRPGMTESEQAMRVDDVLSRLVGEVDCEYWLDNGGDQARCYWLPPLLVVEAPPVTQDGVAAFLSRLRRGG